MGMKLDILVPHYKEPWETCKFLFDSIAVQRGIDFKDISVIMAQDGTEGQIEIPVADYPFGISRVVMNHGGVSAARNFALDCSDADYVMFCDADDGFLNNYGLHLVFSAMQEGYDIIGSCFVEEQRDEEGNYKIIRHDKDVTFVHGKAYRREFLFENNIRFDKRLTIHEDGYFNCLAHTIAENTKTIETPFYLWKWNDDSTVRRDKEPTKFVLRTYDKLMDCRIALAEELQKRGYINEFQDTVIKTFLDSYYDFNKPTYLNNENKKLRVAGEKAFKRFFDKFYRDWCEAAIPRKGEIAFIARANAYNHGMLMEQITIKDWLKHISSLK